MNTLIVKVDEEQILSVVKKAVAEAMTNIQAQYFNKKEASNYLKISPVTLWTYERQGHIKSIRVGGRQMFTREELDRFASGRKK